MADSEYTGSVRTCRKCSIEKSLDAFSVKASAPDGRQIYCKACMSSYGKTDAARQSARESYRRARAANPERFREQARKWNAANPDKVAAYAAKQNAKPTMRPAKARWMAAYRAAHPEQYAQITKKYRDANRERIAEVNRLRREKKRAEIIASAAAYRAANREALAVKGKAYREKNHARELERSRNYHERKPEVAYANTLAYRARKRGAFVEIVKPLVVFERDGWRCHLCGRKTTRRTASIDHIVPLSKGGTHEYANCQTAHLKCNMSKGAKVLGQLRLVG